MTGRTAIATAHWRRLDGQGTDRCTLSRLDHGWMLVGQSSRTDNGYENTLSYDVRCTPDMLGLSADIGGNFNGRDLAIRLHRTKAGWHLNDVLQPHTADCEDLDLSFTPATNLIPLRRAELGVGTAISVRAAWLKPDLSSIERLDQVYTRLSPDLVGYSSTTCKTQLKVHASGFVTHYPDLWEGWVDA